MSETRLLVATHNRGKVIEYQDLLKDVPLELVSLDDLGITEDVAETGQTFQENAWLKSRAYCRMSGLLTLSDDSGLEADALGGEPGVHTARYGGDPGFTDRDRYLLLLRNLEGVPWAKRTARFRCVIAISQPGGSEASVVGSVAGMIQYEPQGAEGFGFDPVFYLPSYRQTLAQLPLAEKNRISHRADAAHRAVAALERLAAAD